jgi:hypothetical protein
MALSLAKDPGHISFLMTPSQPLIDFADPLFCRESGAFCDKSSSFLNKSGKSRKNSSGFFESWRCPEKSPCARAQQK